MFSQGIRYYGDDVMDDGNSRYEIESGMRSWPCRQLTYFFVNGTNDIAGDDEQLAIRNALASWSSVTNIDFLETCDQDNADIRFFWGTGDHGDPCTVPDQCFFDGASGRLAHAWPPPVGLGLFAGDVHFDDDEFWRMDGGGDYDLETVAVHEIGHSLGLDHSSVSGAVMEEYYHGMRRSLTSDDILGIRSIYGFRVSAIEGSNLDCSTASDTFFVCPHNNYSYSWAVPSGLTISSGQGTNQIIVSKTYPNSCGLGSISVTVNTDCDEVTYVRKISYPSSLPPAPFHSYIIYDEARCCYNFGLLMPYQQCFTKFHWVINGTDYYTNEPILYSCLDPSITHYFSTNVSAINDCGEGPYFFKYIIAQPFTSIGCYGRSHNNEVVEIYPNPSSDIINIEILKAGIDLQEELNIDIFNWEGKLIKHLVKYSSEFSIPIQDFNPGHYYVKIQGRNRIMLGRFVVIR